MSPQGEARLRDVPVLSRLELWVVRLLNLPVVVLCRVLDLCVLVRWPRLLGTYLRLWARELRHSPYRQPRSFEARLALKASGQVTDELVYGELPVAMALWLFWRAGVGPTSEVLDLGAGRGRPLLAARALGAAARGVELLGAHVEAAASALARTGIRLEQGDMKRAPLGAPSHVYLNWCGLSDGTRAEVESRLAALPSGTWVLSVAVPPRGEAFQPVRSQLLLFTWGLVRVHLSRRR